jgi:transposase
VIQGYLNGKSRDQIAKETGASTGKVSNTIKEWKRGINIPGIDELRAFTITLKKSWISTRECASGYRMIKLMKILGVG